MLVHKSPGQRARRALVIALTGLAVLGICLRYVASIRADGAYIGVHADPNDAERAFMGRIAADARRSPRVDNFTIHYYYSWPGLIYHDDVDWITVEYSRSEETLYNIDFGGTWFIRGVTIAMMEEAQKQAHPDGYLLAHGAVEGP